MNDSLIEAVTAEVLKQLQSSDPAGRNAASRMDAPDFPLGISKGHIHLSREHMDVLFGPGSELSVLKKLIQPGQFAARETVTVSGPKGSIGGFRIVGPIRGKTQVEISRTEGITLGIDAPVRVSGDLTGSARGVLVGPKGMVLLAEGVIVAMRHVHLEPDRARKLSLKDKDVVSVRFPGERGGTLEEFVVRVGPGHHSEIHLDTDEANALGVKNGQVCRLIYR